MATKFQHLSSKRREHYPFFLKASYALSSATKSPSDVGCSYNFLRDGPERFNLANRAKSFPPAQFRPVLRFILNRRRSPTGPGTTGAARRHSLAFSGIARGKLIRYVTSESSGRINKLIKASVRYTEATPLTRPRVSMRFYIYLWSRSRDGVGSAQPLYPPSVSRRRYSVYSPADRIHCEAV